MLHAAFSTTNRRAAIAYLALESCRGHCGETHTQTRCDERQTEAHTTHTSSSSSSDRRGGRQQATKHERLLCLSLSPLPQRGQRAEIFSGCVAPLLGSTVPHCLLLSALSLKAA